MDVKIYHNARCSKSRQTLQILQEKGIEPGIIEYLKTPPDREELNALLKMLGLQPRELMRTGESVYKELGLDNDSLGHDELVNAMIENPVLIQRPIVIKDGRAIIGRPPETVLEIL